jgi:hypothetical protein
MISQEDPERGPLFSEMDEGEYLSANIFEEDVWKLSGKTTNSYTFTVVNFLRMLYNTKVIGIRHHHWEI